MTATCKMGIRSWQKFLIKYKNVWNKFNVNFFCMSYACLLLAQKLELSMRDSC